MVAEGTGALEPKEIVVSALNVLLSKLSITSLLLKSIADKDVAAPKTTYY